MGKHQVGRLRRAIVQYPIRYGIRSTLGRPNYHHSHPHRYLAIVSLQMGRHRQDRLGEQTMDRVHSVHQGLHRNTNPHPSRCNRSGRRSNSLDYRGNGRADFQEYCHHNHRNHGLAIVLDLFQRHRHRFGYPNLHPNRTNHPNRYQCNLFGRWLRFQQ